MDEVIPVPPLARSITNGLNIGSDYTDEEREFLVAVDRYKRVHHRPHPTWREVLALVKSLGYRKDGQRRE